MFRNLLRRGPGIKPLLSNWREIPVFPASIGLVAAGAIIAVVAVFFIGGSSQSNFHAARGLPYIQGVSLFNDGAYDQAVAQFDNAIRFNSDDQDSYWYRGRAYSGLGEHQTAIDDFERALKLDSSLPLVYLDRGSAYLSLGQHQQAVVDFDKALELDSMLALAYHNRGEAHQSLGRDQQAIDDYEAAGDAYSDLGQQEQAIEDYDKVIQLDPDRGSAYAGRGSVTGTSANT